ncbi:hypothetical protein GZ178_07965, partial [Dermatophilus congolensis]|nr:hypothetical protein [Dermatophilus congolensis]
MSRLEISPVNAAEAALTRLRKSSRAGMAARDSHDRAFGEALRSATDTPRRVSREAQNRTSSPLGVKNSETDTGHVHTSPQPNGTEQPNTVRSTQPVQTQTPTASEHNTLQQGLNNAQQTPNTPTVTGGVAALLPGTPGIEEPMISIGAAPLTGADAPIMAYTSPIAGPVTGVLPGLSEANGAATTATPATPETSPSPSSPTTSTMPG